MDSQELRRIAFGLALMFIYIVIFYNYGPAWNTPRGTAVTYSALAFLCVTLTVSLVNTMRVVDTTANRLLAGVAGFGFIIFAGSAVSNLWRTDDKVIHTSTAGIFLNIVSLFFASIIILWYSEVAKRPIYDEPTKITKYLGIVSATVGTLVSLWVTIILQTGIPDEIILFSGYSLGLCAAFAYLLAAAMMFKNRKIIKGVSPVRMGASFFLLGIATINHVYILPSPSGLWLLTMGLIAMAFIYAIVGITVPHLETIGVSKNTSLLFAIAIDAVVLVPLLLIYLVDNLTTGLVFVDIGLTIAIHFSAAILAGGTAAILYQRSKTTPTLWQKPVVMLFVYWAIAEVAIAVSPLTPLYPMSETSIPYVSGAVVATLLLSIAYRRSFSPHKSESEIESRRLYIMAFFIFTGYIIFSEWIRLVLRQLFSGFNQEPLAASFMLAFSYLSLFAMLNLFFALVSLYGGKIEFNTNIAGFTALWVIVIIIRANFPIWSTGWWINEFILYAAAIGGAIYLIISYAKEVNAATDLKRRIFVQEQILSKEIQEHIQKSEQLVESLGTEKDIDRRLDILSSALSELSQAEKIANHLNVILTNDRFDQSNLVPVDLVDVFTTVMSSEVCDCTPSINLSHGECIVLANDMLTDAIRFMMLATIRRIGKVKSISIALTQYLSELWKSNIIIDIKTQNAEEKKKMLLRYTTTTIHEIVELNYAKHLIEMFNGNLELSFDVKDNEHILMEMEITLPAVHDPL